MVDSLTGQQIGDYLLGPLLGAGGMGQVYKATSASDPNTAVALKLLNNEFADDPLFQARFIREIRIMQALNHENIIPIVDHGLSDNYLYYAMRLINGMNLATMLNRGGFTPATFWEVLRQISAGLDYGHQQKTLHRDLKPDNIFVERNKEAGTLHVFIGDFGLSKQVGVDQTLTEEGAVMGTPAYMSPECVLGERVDERSDVYSLAVITYEALLGVTPFHNTHPHLIAMAHVTEEVPAPGAVSPGFPAPLEKVLLHGLEKDRDKRYQTAREFAEAYHEALHSVDTPNLLFME